MTPRLRSLAASLAFAAVPALLPGSVASADPATAHFDALRTALARLWRERVLSAAGSGAAS